LEVDEEAAILASIGTHSRRRPRTIIEVAQYLDKKLSAPGANMNWVAKTVGLKGTIMVTRLIACLKLPETVRNVIGWDGPIGLHSAWEISTLESDEDMDALAKVAVDFGLSKKEIVDIVQLKKKNPDSSIIECVERVKKQRPVITKGFAVVTSIRKETLRSLTQEAIQKSVPSNVLLQQILTPHFPENSLSSVFFRDGFLFLILNEAGYQRFMRLPKELSIAREDVAEELLSRERENGKQERVGSTVA
jgi:hypothetical protein